MPRFLHPLTDLLEMLPHEDDVLRPSADELFRLARFLDERGMTKEADRITDSMVRTAAYEGAGWGGTGQYQMNPQAQPQGGYGMQQGYGGGYAQPQQNPLNDPIGRSISYMNAVKAAQQAQQSNNPRAYQQAYQRAAQAWGMMGEGEQAGMAKKADHRPGMPPKPDRGRSHNPRPTRESTARCNSRAHSRSPGPKHGRHTTTEIRKDISRPTNRPNRPSPACHRVNSKHTGSPRPTGDPR